MRVERDRPFLTEGGVSHAAHETIHDVTSIRFQSVNTAYYNFSIPKTCHETLNSTYVQVLDHPSVKI